MNRVEPLRVDGGLQKPVVGIERYQRVRKKHTEKGREPITSREAVLKDVAAATGTPIPRWCRYDENALFRALVRLNEAKSVTNKAAYFTWLLKHP